MRHEKNPDGSEWLKEYDANGNMTHSKCSDGDECWWEYDANGNMIHAKIGNAYEYYCEYDSHGNMIIDKSPGRTICYEYIYKKIKGKYLIEWMLANPMINTNEVVK
jgi:YD repeat-containing protein